MTDISNVFAHKTNKKDRFLLLFSTMKNDSPRRFRKRHLYLYPKHSFFYGSGIKLVHTSNIPLATCYLLPSQVPGNSTYQDLGRREDITYWFFASAEI